MTDRDITQPTAHEQKVAEEEQERTGQPTSPEPGGSEDRVSGQPGDSSYEDEIEAEREGRPADEADDDTPLDVAYKPKTG